jgi:hypothetical protein
MFPVHGAAQYSSPCLRSSRGGLEAAAVDSARVGVVPKVMGPSPEPSAGKNRDEETGIEERFFKGQLTKCEMWECQIRVCSGALNVIPRY